MKYYDIEYRRELLSFLDGYKNILIYLKEKDEGIAEVLITDSLKKLENHIKIITPGRFDALSTEVKKIKDKQAVDYYNEQLEAAKKNTPQMLPDSETMAVTEEIMAAIARIEQQLSELKDTQRQPLKQENKTVHQAEKAKSEGQDMYEQLEAQLEEPDALM